MCFVISLQNYWHPYERRFVYSWKLPKCRYSRTRRKTGEDSLVTGSPNATINDDFSLRCIESNPCAPIMHNLQRAVILPLILGLVNPDIQYNAVKPKSSGRRKCVRTNRFSVYRLNLIHKILHLVSKLCSVTACITVFGLMRVHCLLKKNDYGYVEMVKYVCLNLESCGLTTS